MKNFDTRTYSINDFLEWDKNNQLELAPKFQRRNVWTDKARSYLMDTIVRGKPIPKIFIRQKLNTKTQASIREVVDGQQRLRTILAYLKDGFQISKKHNSTYGGLFFSQLDQVDPNAQANILNYEVSVDLLVNMPDPEVLDVFGRLNSYSVVLNDQEKINADHFGPFKTLADEVAHSNNQFWIENKILTEQQVLRMGDVTLAADILIATFEGIKSKKQVRIFYDKYEDDFNYDPDEAENKFGHIIKTIKEIFAYNLKETEFSRTHLFYTLFLALYHREFRIPNLAKPNQKIEKNEFAKISFNLEKVDKILSTPDVRTLSSAESQFFQDCKRATTDSTNRIRRCEFVLDLMYSNLNK